MEEGRVVKEEYTEDGTVNLKGKPVLRSKTGGWKACSFVVGKISISFFLVEKSLYIFLLGFSL